MIKLNKLDKYREGNRLEEKKRQEVYLKDYGKHIPLSLTQTEV